MVNKSQSQEKVNRSSYYFLLFGIALLFLGMGMVHVQEDSLPGEVILFFSLMSSGIGFFGNLLERGEFQ